MIQIAPQMRILVAVEAIDLRRGIDGLAQVCKDVLRSDPFCGALLSIWMIIRVWFVMRNGTGPNPPRIWFMRSARLS